MNYSKSALLIIDMQYDFMSGGSLEVKNANDLIESINKLMKLEWGLVVASKDWHPENHISFGSNHKGSTLFEEIELDNNTKQVMWPDHCIQGTAGAEIHHDIDSDSINAIVLKGENPNVDSYSAFYDNNHLEKTEMDGVLKEKDIESIYVVGLARDYCVRWTAIDGQKLGYKTYFIFDVTKPVNEDFDNQLLTELAENHVSIVNLQDLV